MSEKIDFVIMWVDPTDPVWQTDKSKYIPQKDADDSVQRYRDWHILKYWFRGVENFAPWVNKIYFVTYGHVPKWLNTNHPKLKVIKHSDYIPKKYLPTFNSHTIELNLHRISDLSENFVLFNDDTFLLNPVKPSDFFRNDFPCDSACMYINIPSGELIDSIINNNITVINKNFSARKCLRKDFLKWFNLKNRKYLYNNIFLSAYKKFAGIHYHHLPSSLQKSTFDELWSNELSTMDKTCSNKFRCATDVNQWLMKYWQICSGRFAPRDVSWGKYYEYNMGFKKLEDFFKSRFLKTICINDTINDSEFKEAMNKTIELFEKKFPTKSKFER